MVHQGWGGTLRVGWHIEDRMVYGGRGGTSRGRVVH